MDDAKRALALPAAAFDRLAGVVPRRPAFLRAARGGGWPPPRRRRAGLLAALALLLVVGGAVAAFVALTPAGQLASWRPAQLQVGVASWYGPGFYGRPTASGAVYTGAALTAAHRSLPLGTQVRVTNLDNGRRVVVKVDDRGPYVRGRVIDLSAAAARRLDMIDDGLARVRVEVLRRPVRRRA